MKAEITGWHDLAVPRRWVAVGAGVIILVGAVAMLIGRELFSPPSAPPSRTAPAKPPAAEPSGFVRFRDSSAGLSISHPSSWRRMPPPDAQVSLLAEGDGGSVLVRTASIGVDVDAGSLAAARRLTDRLVRVAEGLKPLRRPGLVALGGLPGYLYLYTFRDGATGQRAAHAHYFLFRGKTMIMVVFKALPAERFTSLAPLFDQIGATLRLEG